MKVIFSVRQDFEQQDHSVHFLLEFFDDFCIFGILIYNIYNNFFILEWSDQFYFLSFCSYCPQIGKENAKISKEQNWSDCSKMKILLYRVAFHSSQEGDPRNM